MTLTQAQTRVAMLNAAKYGGYGDWRLPTIKEQYSLMNFTGKDPSGFTGTDTSTLVPFIDRTYFNFGFGDTSAGERIIDSQYASSNLYVGNTTMLFGVNFADGRVKGYGLTLFGSDKTFYAQYVRGSAYGNNDYADNSDATITDKATHLMWTKGDSAQGFNWQEALAWVQTKNAESYLGHSDWRLPNAKELQGIVDYTRSPGSTSSAASMRSSALRASPMKRVSLITLVTGPVPRMNPWVGQASLLLVPRPSTSPLGVRWVT